MASRARFDFLAPGLMLLAAALALQTPLNRAADLRITPDSIEQVCGAMRLASGESFAVCVDQTLVPPRYPPWFGWLLAPVFLLGKHPGLAILPITLAALLCIWLTFRLASDLGGRDAGLCAATALVILPTFGFWSAEIMTDVPAAAATLWCLRKLLRLADPDHPEGHAEALHCGLAMMLAFLLRPALGVLALSAAILMVSRFGLRGALPRLLWMAAPMLAALGAQLLWNLGAYGAVGRSGYQYWVAEIYDHPEILFPDGAFRRNLGNLIDTRLPLVLGLGLLLLAIVTFRSRGAAAAWRPSHARGWRLALALHALALPYFWLHLRYYSGRPRYFLPIFPPAIALAAGLALPLLGRFGKVAGRLAVVAALVVGIGVQVRRVVEPAPPGRYDLVLQIARLTPEDSLVISTLPPDYMRLVADPSGKRDYLIVSRDEEYASKTLTGPGVGRPAVDVTADEIYDEVLDEVAKGRPVYVLTAELWRPRSRNLLERLRRDARCEALGEGLLRVRPR